MMKRTRFEAAIDKREALKAAETSGKVADSQQVRMALMEQVKSGEKTLLQVQTELKAIKRNAKKNGLVTRDQAFTRG
jgi:predicted DNA-binding protein YlxM (UPF0122 family)